LGSLITARIVATVSSDMSLSKRTLFASPSTLGSLSTCRFNKFLIQIENDFHVDIGWTWSFDITFLHLWKLIWQSRCSSNDGKLLRCWTGLHFPLISRIIKN
jgi:hypothetical protein